jgi:hypothetical protein
MVKRTANFRFSQSGSCIFGSIHLKEGTLLDIEALSFHGGIVAPSEEIRPVCETISG